MSIATKKPYIKEYIDALSDDERAAIITALNSSFADYAAYDLATGGPHTAISTLENGVYKTRLYVKANENICGILIKKTKVHFIAISTGAFPYTNLQVFEVVNEWLEPRDKYLTVDELRNYCVDGGQSGGAGLVITPESDTTVSGWDVPDLSVAQVRAAYNALKAGKHVTVTNANEDVCFIAVLGDGTETNPSIVLKYYWLGDVDYQINVDGDDVAITQHAAGGGSSGLKLYKHEIRFNSPTGVIITLITKDVNPYTYTAYFSIIEKLIAIPAFIRLSGEKVPLITLNERPNTQLSGYEYVFYTINLSNAISVTTEDPETYGGWADTVTEL